MTLPGPIAGLMRIGLRDGMTCWVFVLGLLGVLPLVLLTPPMQVGDEPQHFARAYQISRLDLVGHANGRTAGAVLPASVSELVRDSLGTTEIDAPRSITPQPLATTLSRIGRPLDPDRVRYTDFTGAAPYSPLPYIPQAIGIALGRLFSGGPLVLLYAARLANALASIFLLTLAVRTVPMARAALAFAGLMPMALYQYASASPDAMTIASALLFTAIAARAIVRGWTGRDVVVAAILGAVFCSHKLVYAPMLVISLPAIVAARDRPRALAMNAVIVLTAIGATAVWWLFGNRGLMLTRVPGTDLHAQAALLLARPFAFVSILSDDLSDRAIPYYIHFVGLIGWGRAMLPPLSYAIAILGMIVSIVIRRPGEPTIPRYIGVWHLLIVAGSIALVELALYLTWSPVGSRSIEGVQGRYFLPLLGLLLFGLQTLLRLPPDEGRSRRLGTVVLGLAAAQILALNATIVSTFSVL